MTTRRSSRSTTTPPYVESSDRATRSSTMHRPRFQPKLKLKVSETQASGMSFLGPYDRELDSDDEDLAFEEQFILRMPAGEDCERLRAMVDKRDISKDVWFKFKDSRRGVFHIGDSTYSSKLVDLPCIIESQKSLDNKNMFKVADICQMLVVEDKIKTEEDVLAHKSFNIDEFIWPHGLTPPLHWVRKRRFRKRVNRRTIETIEQEVERLLAEDAKSSKVTYDVLDNVNPDLSDSEFIDPEEPTMEADVEMDGEFAVPTYPMEDDEEEEEEEEEEGDIDEELAAELAREMGEEGDEEGSQSDASDESSEAGDDDDDEDEEVVQAKKLLLEEIRDLEVAVARKETEISTSVNPLIKKRFEDQLKKMRADLEQKQAQREQLIEEQRQQRMGKEGGPSTVDAVDADVEQGVEEDEDADMEEVVGTPG
ncbi:TAFII55 protein conserved region-domain-containing protein [Hysterangium stoloniferum]|nr:TAFII55 protein conserved region-domain-containing protein [Hysterangium stoloniferum]